MQTQQEIFDHVANFLLAQGGPSYGDGCLYIKRNGAERRCAAGCLFGPEHETMLLAMNNKNIEQIIAYAEDHIITLPPFMAPNMHFLKELQRAHDSNVATKNNLHELGDDKWLERWKSSMRRIAAIYQLNPLVLDDAKQTN